MTDVIVRDVTLPEIIQTAIASKKEREQEVEKQRAELARVELEAQQQVKQAEARESAAVSDANAQRTLADAEAYKIRLLQDQLAKSPNYIKLIKAERWNGQVPKISTGGNGGAGLLIDLRAAE